MTVKIPGLDKDKLDVSISVLSSTINNTREFQYSVKYKLKRSIEGAGDVVFDIGFKPTYVYIEADYPLRFATSRTITIDQDGLQTIASYNEDTSFDILSLGKGSSSSVPAVYVYRDTVRRQILYMKSFDENGFTLEYGINGTNDVEMFIFAMG